MSFLVKFRIRHLAFGLAVFFVSVTLSVAQKPIPELWGQRVHDEAHALQPGTVDQLEKQLKIYEDSTSNQVAILIVQSLDGDILEEYSIRVAEKWKLGQKEKDNGVLLLISVDDHKMRIEVGHGLEGVLTDVQCNRIIRNEIAPAFRRNDYDAGVIAGIDGIVNVIKGEYKASDADDVNKLTGKEKFFLTLFIFGILALLSFLAIFNPGWPGWRLYLVAIPIYAFFPAIIIGYSASMTLLGIYVVALPILKLTIGRNKRMQQWAKSSPTSGRSSGWSGGRSSRSGGSSFSGGGGSFGGGGSSGGW